MRRRQFTPPRSCFPGTVLAYHLEHGQHGQRQRDSPAHPTEYGKDFGLSGTQAGWACAANEAMVGFYGALSASMDQLQPICEALTPVYKL